MRLILLAVIGILCLAFIHGQDVLNGEERVNLLDEADQGSAHAVNGDREARSHHYDAHNYDPHRDAHYDPHHDHHYDPHHDTHHGHYVH